MRTAEWLKDKRVKHAISQGQLAKKIGISINTIAHIEQGQRLGSTETWKKIENYFESENNPSIKISYESEELINELREDIEEFGEDHPCILIYKIVGDYILFTNYDFITKEDPFNPDKELEDDEKYIETTFKYALEVFEAQNNI